MAIFSFATADLALASSSIGGTNVNETGTHILPMLMSILAAILQALSWAIGQFILVVIGMLIIPILGYNEFGDSNIVNIGWPLVRDTINMFVIIILLAIAIMTMLGIKKVNWQQQIPRLFIAVVAVNFSRTIVLFMIDIGQVVMFMFVNALRDIAAGNFVNLFRMGSFMELSEPAMQKAFDQGGYHAIGFLGSSYLVLVLLFCVAAVLVLMTLIFIYRIIVLWVLIILSPAAFFMGGIKEIVSSAAGTYSEWWKTFTGALMLGPILTFFLWLALASAAGGGIAATENFSGTSSEDISTIYSAVFDLDNLTSLFIAIVLLVVGFKAASQSASALGGIAAKYVREDVASKAVKGVMKSPYTAGKFATKMGIKGTAAGIGLGLKGAGALAGVSLKGGKFVAGKVLEHGGAAAKRGVIEAGRQLEARHQVGTRLGAGIVRKAAELQGDGTGFVRNVAADALGAVGGKIEQAGRESAKAGRKANRDRNVKSGRTNQIRRIEAFSEAENKKKLLMSGKGSYEQDLALFASDKQMQKDAKEEWTKREEGVAKKARIQELIDAGGLKEYQAKDRIKNNPDEQDKIKASAKEKTKTYFDKQMAEALKFLKSDEGKKVRKTEDFDKAGYLKTQTANMHLRETKPNGEAGDYIYTDKEAQDIIDDKDFDRRNLSTDAVADTRTRQMLKEKASTTGGKLANGTPIAGKSQWDEITAGSKVPKPVQQAARNADSVVPKSDAEPDVRSAIHDAIKAEDGAQRMATALDRGDIKVEDIKVEDFDIDGAKLTEALMNPDANISDVPDEFYDKMEGFIKGTEKAKAIDDAIIDTTPAGQTPQLPDKYEPKNADETAQKDATLFSANRNAEQARQTLGVYDHGNFKTDDDGNKEPAVAAALEKILEQNLQAIHKLGGQIGTISSGTNDLTKTVAKVVKSKDIKKMTDKLSRTPKKDPEHGKIVDAIQALHITFRKQAAVSGASGDVRKIDNELANIVRYTTGGEVQPKPPKPRAGGAGAGAGGAGGGAAGGGNA